LLDSTFAGQSLIEYAEKLEEWSGGKLTLEIFDGGVLGGDADILAGVQQGTIDCHQGANTALAAKIPEVYILDSNGIFDTPEEFNQVFSRDGELFDLLQTCYEEQGLHLINIYTDSFRQVTSNVAVISVEDLQAVRMRTMENSYQVAFWEMLGVTAVPYSFTELYLALEQDVVNSAEGPLNTSVIPSRLYEVQEYLIMTNHMPSVMVTTINLERWEGLSEEYQQLLERMFDEQMEERISNAAQEEENLLLLCQEYGMTVLYPDEELKEAIRQTGLKNLDTLEDVCAEEVFQAYRAALEEVGVLEPE
ncbi:MAG: TRAP transporter substrate-binding protein, partial [Lachnospiraceae bacterium]|nr:TRAP transporter substrate-binding protein [Lachnospiraceae bacterium]